MSEPQPHDPEGKRSVPRVPPDQPVRTVFFGSGAFAVPVLDALMQAPEVELVAVVGVPDRPAGRRAELTPSPVVARARGLGLPIIQPPRLREPEAVQAIAALEPGLGVLADYGRIVPPTILDLPAHGILNLHPSLLPRHRGASPIPATILAGDAEAGVTLLRMDERLDAGPILASVAWPLRGDETAPEIEARAAEAAAGLLRENLGRWLRAVLPGRPQDEAEATMTRPLTRDDGRLDPGCPVDRLERQVRAFQPWPGSHLETRAGRLAVWRASIVGDEGGGSGGRPGDLVEVPGGLGLLAVDGALRLDEVQLAGGRRMSGAELLRGHPSLLAVGR